MSAPPAVALSDIVNRTLTLLRATVPREVANEALLSKPPFRFLHDVVMEVMLTTGFGMGLWDGAEMDAIGLRSAEGREGKGRFLSKWVALVCVARGLTQSPPPFRVPNTLAGQEPEMTNILLQVTAGRGTG